MSKLRAWPYASRENESAKIAIEMALVPRVKTVMLKRRGLLFKGRFAAGTVERKKRAFQ